MTELFRFIEQAFALPARTNSIDVGSQSNYQTSLRNAVSGNDGPNRIRSLADGFLNKHFPTVDGSFTLASQLLSFTTQLSALAPATQKAVNQLVGTVFNTDVRALVASAHFLADKELLNDTLVSVKLVTGFDRVNAADLVKMRQAVAFLEDLAKHRLKPNTR
jgi:hypothetical protein